MTARREMVGVESLATCRAKSAYGRSKALPAMLLQSTQRPRTHIPPRDHRPGWRRPLWITSAARSISFPLPAACGGTCALDSFRNLPQRPQVLAAVDDRVVPTSWWPGIPSPFSRRCTPSVRTRSDTRSDPTPCLFGRCRRGAGGIELATHSSKHRCRPKIATSGVVALAKESCEGEA
jgi:hypothetical protein